MVAKKNAFAKLYIFLVLALLATLFTVCLASYSFSKTSLADSWIGQPSDVTFLKTGDGTTDSPYLISNPYQLATVSANNSMYATSSFKLTSDIDLSGFEWTPIGNMTTKYQGTFDGNHHTIRGITIKEGNLEMAALFGATNRATIQNITLENTKIFSNYQVSNVSAKAAGLVAYAYQTTFKNIIHLSGSVFARGYEARAAGIVADAVTSNFDYCFNYASVTSYSYGGASNAAGIASTTSSNAISFTHTKNSGKIVALAGEEKVICRAGGIVAFVGYAEQTVNASANDGDIQAGSPKGTQNIFGVDCQTVENKFSYAGGISAINAKITNCMNTASVKSYAKQYTEYGVLNDPQSLKSDKVDSFGGVFGIGAWTDYIYMYNYDATGNYKEGMEIVSTYNYAYAGGIAGTSSYITNCYTDGEVLGGKQTKKISIVTTLRRRRDKANDSNDYQVIFNTLTFTSNYYYGSINGNRTQTSTESYNFGREIALDTSVKLKTSIYASGKTLTSSDQTTINLGSNTQVINRVDLSYIQQLDLILNSASTADTKQVFTRIYLTNGATMEIAPLVFNVGYVTRYKIKAATDITVSDLKTTEWRKNEQINKNRPYIAGLYW